MRNPNFNWKIGESYVDAYSRMVEEYTKKSNTTRTNEVAPGVVYTVKEEYNLPRPGYAPTDYLKYLKDEGIKANLEFMISNTFDFSDDIMNGLGMQRVLDTMTETVRGIYAEMPGWLVYKSLADMKKHEDSDKNIVLTIDGHLAISASGNSISVATINPPYDVAINKEGPLQVTNSVSTYYFSEENSHIVEVDNRSLITTLISYPRKENDYNCTVKEAEVRQVLSKHVGNDDTLLEKDNYPIEQHPSFSFGLQGYGLAHSIIHSETGKITSLRFDNNAREKLTLMPRTY